MSSDCDTEAELPSQEDPHSEDLTDFNDPTSTETNDEQPTDSAGNTTPVQNYQDDPAAYCRVDEQTYEPSVNNSEPTEGWTKLILGSYVC